MPKSPSMLTPDNIVRVRQAYADGTPIRDIRRDHDITLWGVYYCLDGGPVAGDTRMFPPLRRRKSGAAGQWGEKSPQRAALVRRLWQAADGQVRKIENRLALEAIEPAEHERDARTMAVLVKTLRELNDLDAVGASQKSKGRDSADAATTEVNYDDPRAIDDFRRELARRIAAINAGESPDSAGKL